MGKLKSLSTKISIYIGVLVLLICVVLGVVTFKKGSDSVKAEIEKSLLLIAEEGSNYLESRFENQLSILETIAERAEIKSMNWEEQMPTIVAEESRLSQFLALAIVDLAGNANYSDGSTANLGDREYVIQAMAGKFVVSDLIVSRVNNSLVLMYAVPIKQNGRVVGALIARRDGTSLSTITDRLGFGENGWAYIINKDGMLYAYPERDLVLNEENIFNPASELANAGKAIQEASQSQHSARTIRYELADGNVRLVGLAPIPSTGWQIAIGALERDVLQNINTLKFFVLGFSLILVVVGVVLGIVIAAQVVNPLRRVQNVIEAVAEGDLTEVVDVKTNDEIGAVGRALNATITSVKDALNLVASTTNELAGTSQEMAAAAEEVSASIEEVASTTNEFSSALDMMNNNAQSTNNAVRDISNQATDGDRAVVNVVEQMNLLRDSTQIMSKDVENLGTLSNQIGQIVDTISAIADQTNLLALNAAIEAARAGDHGRGFAVVADEVRKLAEESSEATADITSLINQIQSGISQTVAGIGSSAEQADQALASVDESGRILRDILSAVEGVANQVSGISAGIEETNNAGHEISSATQEQAASIEQIASSSQNLTNMGQNLQDLVGHFKLEI